MPEYGPLDYSSTFANVPNPQTSFLQGMEGGLGMQNAQLVQQQKQYQFQRMQQMQQASLDVAYNPTPEKISQLSIAFPEMSENFKRSYDMLQPQQQRADLQHMTEVHAAMQNGRPDIAATLLNDRATALENNGSPPQMVQAAKAAAQWASTDPNTFKAASGIMLASVMGPDKYGETFRAQTDAEKTQATTPAAVQEAQANAAIKTTEAAAAPQKVATDIANVNSQITQRAGQLALDRDKLLTEAQLKLKELGLQYGTPAPETAARINEAAVSAAAGEQSASRLLDLSDRMEQSDRATGMRGTAAESWKRAFGGGDGATALKQEYARIVNNQALAGTKEALGGRVTDVDMKAAMGVVPDANASTETVTSYLRGVAKLQQVDAARQQAQAEWLAQTGRNAHLGPAPHDLTVMGTQVPQGTTFADFSRQFLQQKAEQIAAQSALARAQGRSYLRFAQPQPDAQPQTGGATGSY
jgi:hypothetical protein